MSWRPNATIAPGRATRTVSGSSRVATRSRIARETAVSKAGRSVNASRTSWTVRLPCAAIRTSMAAACGRGLARGDPRAVDLARLVAQVAQVRPGLDRAAGRALDHLRGAAFAPVAVDVLAQPLP